MDGRKPPSKYRPFPLSQMFSILDRDDIKVFSASAAACWFSGRPSNGASTVFRTNLARAKTSRRGHEKRGNRQNFARKRKTASLPMLKGNYLQKLMQSMTPKYTRKKSANQTKNAWHYQIYTN